MRLRGAIFDLDGVIVDTAAYHYRAWCTLAHELGFSLTELDNERLKGVSRRESLDILLSVGGLSVGEEDKEALAARKNALYIQSLAHLTGGDILPGAEELLRRLREQGIPTALGSASRNAPVVLEKLGITSLFDAVVDGSMVQAAKPDPEVFLLCAKAINRAARDCAVFEDAAAGIEAARRGGMFPVGVGRKVLPGAGMTVTDLKDVAGLLELF
ncbi:MAG: beta-phosphoglucomutase [Clostridiales bacterium]|nr:beta-phosphoglucomutase [Clostridiales bacterium]